jgi:hypothetical protein
MAVYQTHNITGAQVLREAPQWVAWKYGALKKNGKRPKVPINPHTGKKADTTDPATWGSFDEAGEAGIGFVLTADDPYVCVDLDNCVKDGEVAPWALAIVKALDSYTEISPSGTGLHIWIKASKPGERCKKGGVEIYDRKHFITWTGESFSGETIEKRQDALNVLYRRLFPERVTPSTPVEALRTDSRSSQGTLDDYEVLQKARDGQYGRKFEALFDRGNDGDHSKSDFELMKHLAFWCGKDAGQMERLFSQSVLGQRDKWTGRKDYRQRTIKNAINATTKAYDPEYGKPKETTREILQRNMVYALATHQWNTGRATAAATDYFTYMAVLKIMYRANKTTAEISERQLAEDAGVGDKTAWESLRRLEDRHSVVVKVVGGGKDEAATYSLKPVVLKKDQTLIIKESLSKFFFSNNTVPIRESDPFWESPKLRNSAPEMPEFDKNGRRLPKGKASPLGRLGKVCAWILDLVHASSVPLTRKVLSERTGIAPKNLVPRYLSKLVTAGLLEETAEGYVTPINVEKILKDELEDSGCNDAERLQKERHTREREAYRTRTRKTDKAPTEEDMDAMREQREQDLVEDFDFEEAEEEFEDFPVPTKPMLVLVVKDYLERNPQAADETPSWIANTIWAFELYPGKPTCHEVTSALEELGVGKSYATRRVA